MGDEFNKRGEWEDAWKQAFDGPEQLPPTRVWQGLENSLMEQQLRRYKRKLFLYQWLAAASVVLLGVWAGWWIFITQPGEQQLIPTGQEMASTNDTSSVGRPSAVADKEAAVDEPINPFFTNATPQSQQPDFTSGTLDSSITGNVSRGLAANEITRQQQPTSGAKKNRYRLGSDNSADKAIAQAAPIASPVTITTATNPSAAVGVIAAEENTSLSEQPLENTNSTLALAPEATSREAMLLLEQGDKKLTPRHVYVAKKAKDKKRSTNGTTWLGASVASTYFNPNLDGSGSAALAWVDQPKAVKGGREVYTANTSSWDEKQKSLPSLDLRLDAAFRLGNRWMLQSSLQYSSYRVNTLSGTFSAEDGEKIYPLYYSNFSYDKLQVTDANSRRAMPVEALNTYTFMSVPLTLSYVIAERLVGVGVSAGISSDVFLGGRIGDMEDRLDEYTLEAGRTSPFNRLHFNALLGAQLFYRAGPNYLITLEPTYRYSITDFSKNGSLFDSRPTGFGVAAGFRFILR